MSTGFGVRRDWPSTKTLAAPPRAVVDTRTICNGADSVPTNSSVDSADTASTGMCRTFFGFLPAHKSGQMETPYCCQVGGPPALRGQPEHRIASRPCYNATECGLGHTY